MLIADPAVANWSAACLPRFETNGFKECITGRRHAHGKEHLNRRVKHVFLQHVNNLMFHLTITAVPLQFTLFTAPNLGD